MFSDAALIVGVDVHQRRNVTLVMDGGGNMSDQLASYLAEMLLLIFLFLHLFQEFVKMFIAFAPITLEWRNPVKDGF